MMMMVVLASSEQGKIIFPLVVGVGRTGDLAFGVRL